MKNLFNFLLMVSMVMMLGSCEQEALQKNEQNHTKEALTPEEEFKYAKDVEFTADNGDRATMRVYGDSENELSLYSNKNFKLIPLNKGESLKEGLIRNNLMELSEVEEETYLEPEDDLTDDDSNIKSDLAFQIVKAPSCERYGVHFNHPESPSRRKWQYKLHFSDSRGQTNVDIVRTNWFRRVYYGLRYQPYRNSDWQEIQHEWYRLNNNESRNHNKVPCYVFRLRVKSKKSSAYVVSFSD